MYIKMDGSKIFKKLRDSAKYVYLYDKDEECVLKYFAGPDGETVQAMFKKKGEEPYLVDIKSPSVFDITLEAEETTVEFYENY